jgi:hypothetical protein
MTARTTVVALACVLAAGCYGLGSSTRPPSPQRETGREFLVGTQAEAPGYGLYSYVLFGAKPTQATRARYVAVVAACLEQISQISEMEDYYPRRQLNITYLMVTEAVPDLVAGPGAGAAGTSGAAQWVVEHYNYARARAVLATVPGEHRDGPYIVSYRLPLTGSPLLASGYLLQDLSHAQPSLAGAWVKTFLTEASNEDYAQPATLRRVAVELRNAVALVAKQWPEVRASVDEAINWVN